jgi:hypothetical protein
MESQDFGWISENTEINLITQQGESGAVMSCEFGFVMIWAVFLVVGSPLGCVSWQQG